MTGGDGIDKDGRPGHVSTGGSRAAANVFALLMLACAAIFVALGLWQVQRLFWKLDLIERVEARVNAAPQPAPSPEEWRSADPKDQEYRRLRVSGRFLHALEVQVQAVTNAGAGFWVVTPLERDDGAIVLINRGFVPPERRDPSRRIEGQVGGAVDVTGLLRLSEPGGAFLRTNDPAGDRWFSRDVAAIAQAKGIAAAAPFFIDADASPNPGGFPLGGLTIVQFRNSHLAYALTWFALAAMALGAAYAIRRRLFA